MKVLTTNTFDEYLLTWAPPPCLGPHKILSYFTYTILPITALRSHSLFCFRERRGSKLPLKSPLLNSARQPWKRFALIWVSILALTPCKCPRVCYITDPYIHFFFINLVINTSQLTAFYTRCPEIHFALSFYGVSCRGDKKHDHSCFVAAAIFPPVFNIF